MNWDWVVIREQARKLFTTFAQVLVFELACFYLLACVVAVNLGPKGYVTFIYHCFQWQALSQHGSTETASRSR